MKFSRDIWYVAFLLFKKYEIKKYDIIAKGKVCCFFDIDDEKWKELKLEFSKSNFFKYKNFVENVKDLAF